MADGIEIEAPGLPRLIDTLDAAGKQIEDMTAASERAGDMIASAARGRAPVLTGMLRSTIEARTSENTVTIGVGTDYGAVIHWGSAARNISANPFLTDAVAETQWVEAYTDEVDRIVDIVEAD